MKNVHYLRPRANYRRILRPADMEWLGLETKENLVWEPENHFVVKLNNKLSDSLVEKFPDEFMAVATEEDDEIPEVPEPLTSLAQSASGAPEQDPNDSEVASDDADESSPPKASRKRREA
jgi:hypothetical protein